MWDESDYHNVIQTISQPLEDTINIYCLINMKHDLETIYICYTSKPKACFWSSGRIFRLLVSLAIIIAGLIAFMNWASVPGVSLKCKASKWKYLILKPVFAHWSKFYEWNRIGKWYTRHWTAIEPCVKLA